MNYYLFDQNDELLFVLSKFRVTMKEAQLRAEEVLQVNLGLAAGDDFQNDYLEDVDADDVVYNDDDN